MSYRGISVNGKVYEYSIGHAGVKFRGHNHLVPLSEIGTPVENQEQGGVEKYEVSPSTIKSWLQTKAKFEPPEPLKDYELDIAK